MKKMMRIETPQLLLRPFEETDEELIYALYSDEDTMRYMPCDVMNREQALAHLRTVVADWEKQPLLSMEMAVLRREDGLKIGRARFHLDPETDTAMIGWLLLREHRGKGYAKEMTRAMLRYAFESLGVHRVCALCHPNNPASRRTLEACGLRQEAHYIQKCRYTKGGAIRWEDELEYALLNTEWASKEN